MITEYWNFDWLAWQWMHGVMLRKKLYTVKKIFNFILRFVIVD